MEEPAGRARIQVEFSSAAEMVYWARGMAQLTQRELAHLAGVSITTVVLCETGKRQPAAELLFKMLNACGYCVSVEPIDQDTNEEEGESDG